MANTAAGYARGAVRAAPKYGQFSGKLPWQNVSRRFDTPFREAAAGLVNPDLQRQYQQSYGDYMKGMAGTGAGRFSRGWGGIGGLQADMERTRKEQIGAFTGQFKQGLKDLWYNPTQARWDEARMYGQPRIKYKIPTATGSIAKEAMGGQVPNRVDWQQSPFTGTGRPKSYFLGN